MKRYVTLTTGMLVAMASALAAQDAPAPYEPTPLFASSDVLHLTLRMDTRTVIRDIDSTKRIEHPAQLSYVTDTGDTVQVDLDVRTRGHFRRQRSNCNFPPLRLDFPRSEMDGTLFEGQDKVKLVTHCQSGRDQYEQYILSEYSVYRSLHVLTDHCHRVRLAQITYIDTEAREDTLVRPAILLESDEELTARIGGTLIELEGVHPFDTHPDYMAMVDVFQYMVGNTDWSVPGLHNIILVDVPSELTTYAVPYDFDWTGMVNARYAKPNERLGIRRVRDRKYRGFCRPPEQLAPVLATFNEKREALYAVYDSIPGLNEKTHRDAVKYLDDFFEVINDDGKTRRAFHRDCRSE